ncbi:glycoside hydrolase family 18 protein [Penicillium longicatenatum]|nr:glycoside hydrolase family 18 protein [Penicillium longicatenatum]
MLPAVVLAVVAGLGILPTVVADTVCSATVPCEIGCCGEYGVCGMGPNYCGSDVCINSCDAKAECNPDNWPSEYVNSTTCPLDVCCSPYGFCGTTKEFCGNKTVTVPSCDASSQKINRVIGYYNSAAARRGCDGMAPYSIPQGVYSHIYFAFGSIDPDSFEVIPDKTSDESLYTQLAALKTRDPDQELWLSIGGWDFSDSDQPTATTFSDLCAADSKTQNAFFKSLISFMGTYGFTGIDIDWEYPAAGDRNGRDEDYKNFPTFLTSLKKALSDYKYGLSITLPTSYWYLQHFDLKAMESSVDWFNVMAYDLHGTWDITDTWTGPYLDAHTNLTEIKTALDLLWGVDVKPSKVTIGLAFYGRSFTIESSSCAEPGCLYLSAGTEGNCSQSAGILFNSEIAALIEDQDLTPTLYKDAAIKTIQWDTDQWIAYDDEDTWKLKADYAKSVCIGGVMVWSVDEDDDVHTYAKGLAAALGNEINLNTTTGLPLSIVDKTSSTSSESTQGSYCRFVNCGDTCPNGFSTIVRDDNKKQLMLDSTECPPGYEGTQTLCCPTSSTLPTCRWRGFNGGKCKGGCESGEAEVGTITAGCRSGYQSACCTIEDSTKPWSECAWGDSCESDDTCPSGYDKFVVGSRQGWGGRKSCSGSKNYNYCCKDSIPDPFTNCAWTGHEVTFTNTEYCSDACPSGSIRIAEESIITIFGNDKTAHTSNCYYGMEAYCCNGTTTTTSVVPRSSPDTFQDETAYEFHFYLNAWLENPTCGAEYVASFDKRDLTERSMSKQELNYYNAVSYVVLWLTASVPRDDLTKIFNNLMSEYGFADEAANITVLTNTLYGYGDPWTGSPVYSAEPLVAETLCNIAQSSNGVEGLGAASEILCELPGSSSSASKRAFDGIGTTSRSSNGRQPTIYSALRGVVNGDLTFHYARWIQGSTERNGAQEIILELAFWIGPTPGTAPTAANLATYGDSDDTVNPDLWVVFHLHIPRDDNTFRDLTRAQRNFYPGVRAMGVYHSQTLHYMGNNADPRAEYEFSNNYAEGAYNGGNMENYNNRAQTLRCRDNSRWYIGRDSTTAITNAQRSNANLPVQYVNALNSFGVWLQQQGLFSYENLAFIWPVIGDYGSDWVPASNTVNGASAYSPADGAFTTNWNFAGEQVDIMGATDVWTTQ